MKIVFMGTPDFAAGALKAAKFLANKPVGIYDMTDVVKTD